MKILSFIPAPIRLHLRRFQRILRDVQSGQVYQFARTEESISDFSNSINLTQAIKQSYLFENKKNNISLASQHINSRLIHPNQILSFWNCIGAPTAKNGYQKGRNIICLLYTSDAADE